MARRFRKLQKLEKRIIPNFSPNFKSIATTRPSLFFSLPHSVLFYTGLTSLHVFRDLLTSNLSYLHSSTTSKTTFQKNTFPRPPHLLSPFLPSFHLDVTPPFTEPNRTYFPKPKKSFLFMGSGAAVALVEVPKRHPRSRFAQLVALAYTAPSKSPLLRSSNGVVVGAALRTGLLHKLRGAPSQDRNAVITHPTRDIAMLSVFAGHGKHGSCLAELAATVVSRQIRRRLPGDGVPLPNSHKLLTPFDDSLERIVEDAFVEANIAVDATPWSRNSGATATVCLVRKGELVVGTIGEPCVMIATRKSGSVQISMLSDSHRLDVAGEKERVERFGGVVAGDSVSDEEGRYMLPFTRSLGDLEMRSSGVCQVPAIRTFSLSSKDTHVILCTQRLWTGSSMTAPRALNNIVDNMGTGCMVDLSEILMDSAFGTSGPTHDATILCAKLR